MNKKAEERLVFNGTRRAHIAPLFVLPHSLPVSAHIKFKALSLDYRKILDVPSGILWSMSEQCLVVSARKRMFISHLQCTWDHSDKLKKIFHEVVNKTMVIAFYKKMPFQSFFFTSMLLCSTHYVMTVLTVGFYLSSDALSNPTHTENLLDPN